MARLCKKTTQQIQSDRMNCAMELSRHLGVVTVLKGSSTVITDGERVVIDAKGTSALSKGGSGDVLAGAIASFAAQGADPFASAVCGVYLHSMAGRELSREFSEYGVRPSELSAAMAKYIARLTEQDKERIE